MQTNLSTLSPRRQRNRQAMIDSILTTARAIMRENGVAALSMQELARRMEMRAPSLYNYFTGLLDIYDALFRLGFTLWDEQLERFTAGAQTWQEEVGRFLEAYMTFALHNPELYQLCFERPVPGFVPSEASLQLSFSILGSAYQRAQTLFDPAQTGLPAEQTVDLVIAIAHGLTAQHLANQPHLPMGQGRFGSLIPPVIAMLEKAWTKA